MQKSKQQPASYGTLSEALASSGFPAPQHPLITLINAVDNHYDAVPPPHRQMLSFYKISYRINVGGTLAYGRTRFDYLEGGLFFASPRQMIGSDLHTEENTDLRQAPEMGGCLTGQITLLIHPDFLIGYPLAQKIKQFNFFSYTVNEALLLSEKEKGIILALLRNIEEELNRPLDEISQDIIISQLELFFSYAQRFYKRQFITRKTLSKSIIEKMDQMLSQYFDFDKANSLNKGLPSVQYLASELNLSSGYLSDLVKNTTGLSAQGYIHEVLLEKAKEQLLATEHTISEIAYYLGFEHPQSFSKFFKSKTRQSPMAFRNTYH
ncbi:Helix-turn-helix domain-containing protein [Arachidicoccus rhizosphaerae]|uniref:Helix-turn-helix domain-containing protein n=1 Tax=Arachidicoccus rhizosphaerae TaxID=551991 RepID=A0A1H3ZGU9_9BACT|nr:helix-turn-helix domain-containing protein [Arachidicoccus rhizosphaerae]SEA22562.1 Helix-turn-helix domain-containing protein [Arachidicoccus rhizosphaerae]